jgi:hypothetical protein
LKNGIFREVKMNETDVVLEYSRRYEYAKYFQYIGAPLFVLSGAGLVISKGAFATAGEKMFLVVCGAAFLASLALLLSSWYRYRCPYCAKNLGVVRNIKFCPYCGVTLQPVSGSEVVFSLSRTEERRDRIGGISSNFITPGSISRSAGSRNLARGTFRPLASDFPEETYPKDIRMFTTSDEMELTKRYIRLIAKDENPPAAVADEPSGLGRRAAPDATEASPRWRNKEKKKLI